ncbi:Ribonuclease H domain [Sesbania bispinosa]|nr:Ribonuclease H domain [Sesbania bispinosa]
MVKWDAPSTHQIAINIDGSVMDHKAGFGGIIRGTDGGWIHGFYGHLGEKDILYAELIAILKGLSLCWDLNFRNVKCMSDSLLAVTLINNGVPIFHQYAAIISNIQALISRDWEISVNHVFRKGNQAADFLAKLGSANSCSFVPLLEPSVGISDILQADSLGVLFPRL